MDDCFIGAQMGRMVVGRIIIGRIAMKWPEWIMEYAPIIWILCGVVLFFSGGDWSASSVPERVMYSVGSAVCISSLLLIVMGFCLSKVRDRIIRQRNYDIWRTLF